MRRWLISIIVLAIIALLAVGGFIATRQSNRTDDVRTLTIEPQTVQQDVTFTGRLEAVRSSDVSFELPGTVTHVFVKEGDTVVSGQALASLDTSNANLELAQAHATTASSQDLKKLAFEQAATDIQHTLDANKEIMNKRQQAVRDAKAELDQAKQVHQQRAIESGDTSAATEATIASLKAAETAYHTAQRTLTETTAAIKQSNAAAQAALETARANYLATTQAARGVAGLSSVEAAEALVAQKVTKHTLVAPFNGVVTTIHRQLGEAATATAPIVTVATTRETEVVAAATETDAIKLTVGMPATITFDALPPTQEWQASITHLAPAATLIEGVPTYTVKLKLDEAIVDAKPGLTANIIVHAASRENVVAVPRRAIITRDRQEYVVIQNSDDSITEKKIKTGLVGSNGTIEVTEGLLQGETVVISPAGLEDNL